MPPPLPLCQPLGRQPRMGHKPTREETRSSFIQHYYQLLDKDRAQRGTIYVDACLTWEEQQFQGKTATVEKLSSLPLQKIQHSITGQDCQPSPDSCIISKVVGQLKADEDPIVGVHQMFLLKTINDAWVCTNAMFRLVLYNFSWPPPSLALMLFPPPSSSRYYSQSSRCSKHFTQMSGAAVGAGAVCSRYRDVLCTMYCVPGLVASDRRSLCPTSASLGKT